VREHVDKTRSDSQTVGINNCSSGGTTEISKSSDAIAAYTYIHSDGWSPASIIDSAVFDNDIEGLCTWTSLTQGGNRKKEDKSDRY
jgi:hypothetical protein